MEENKKENVFKKLLKKDIIISLVVGLLLGMLLMFIVNAGIEVSVSGNLITKNKLYNKMKNYYSIDLILESVDEVILNKKYKLADEEMDELKETANGYIEQYEQYGYTKEEFLEQNGFENFESFVEYLGLDYKRSLYVYDYLESQLEENAVKDYYEKNAFGKVNTKHILVKISDDMDETKALELANEIISKLNNGENFDTLAQEYTANYTNNVITEELGEMGAFDNLENAYVNGMKELEVGKYTQTPVKTSYGYHVIYCVDKQEKEDTISSADKMMIIDKLATEEGLTLDDMTYYKALIKMREEANLKFFDKDFKEKYEEYCKPYVELEENEEINETELDISLDNEE